MSLPANDFILGTHPRINHRHQKDLARMRIIKKILECNFERIKALTNPSCWWIFELWLEQLHPKFSCVGIERDPQLFRLSAMRIPKRNKPLKVKHSQETGGFVVSNGNGFCLIEGDVHDYLASPNDFGERYNVVWLDLGAPINLKLINSIRCLPNRIQNKTLLAVDALALRESLEITKLIKGDRLTFFKEIVPQLIPVKLLDIHRYSDHYKSPMIQAIYLYENPELLTNEATDGK